MKHKPVSEELVMSLREAKIAEAIDNGCELHIRPAMPEPVSFGLETCAICGTELSESGRCDNCD